MTIQNNNPTAYIGNIKVSGEINTFMDQAYRTNTLFADPISPITTVTFQVEDINAKISMDLYKDILTNETMFTNTNGSDAALLNGPTTFNGLSTLPTFPSGKWSSVSIGMSTAALAASRVGGSAEQNNVMNASLAASPNPVQPLPPQQNQSGFSVNNAIDGGAATAAIMNNINFEVSKVSSDGKVLVSMGSTSRNSGGEAKGGSDASSGSVGSSEDEEDDEKSEE